MRKLWSWLLYVWALPTSALGLLLVLPTLMTGGGVRLRRGVLEVHGGVTRWLLRYATLLPGGATAMTLGHVVLGQSRRALAASRRHERVHVRQAERWGPLFIPMYLLASVWAALQGKSPYLDNVFEREAFQCSTPRLIEPFPRRRTNRVFS